MLLYVLMLMQAVVAVACVKCGYDDCQKINLNALNVHIIAHSHTEPGWAKTLKEYYADEVRSILTSVVKALNEIPKRRYVHAETVYLNEWWQEQDDAFKKDFVELVNNGQLEIVGGAWTTNDEATTHYQSIIDQFTVGLRFLNESLGECGMPKIGWQLDTSGHSKQMATILIGLGYEGLFFEKIDFRERWQRKENREMEFLWNGIPMNVKEPYTIFTSILFGLQNPPAGLCFDMVCPGSKNRFNIKTKAELFRRVILEQCKSYPTNNILVLMGSTHHFQKAEGTFGNLDTLISAMDGMTTDEGTPIKVFYSTPSCYIKSVNEIMNATNLELNIYNEDFFPYANTQYSYWTGFYTSRPTLKRMEREANNLLQMTKQLHAFLPSKNNRTDGIEGLQKAIATMQHHNAITGTQKLDVAKDYVHLLDDAMKKSIFQDGSRIVDILKKPNSNLTLKFDSCPMLNISICEQTKGTTILLAVYNPLGKPVSRYVKIPVNGHEFKIVTHEDKKVIFQITPSMPFLQKFRKAAAYDLTFYAENIPPLGTKVYHISDISFPRVTRVQVNSNFVFGNQLAGFELNHLGYLKTITINNRTMNLEQNLMYYLSHPGDAFREEQPSGAYVFQPINQAKHFPSIEKLAFNRGVLFDEVIQQYSSWAGQIIRVYKKKRFVEFDWIVGPIDVEDRKGKEVISRFETPLQSGDTFYTDSNGRDEMKRVRNFRDYHYYPDGMIAANYYPIVSKVCIKDEQSKMKFSVLTDRSEGGSSLFEGQLEIMLHRRLLKDDGFGIDEAMNDDEFEFGAVARGSHWVTFGSIDDKYDDELVLERHLEPWIFISDISKHPLSSLKDIKKHIRFEFSGLQQALPHNVHLLTLEPWKIGDSSLLIRLEYASERGEAIYVRLKDRFTLFNITCLTEMSLGANQKLSDKQRYNWKIKAAWKRSVPKSDDETLKDLIVMLRPMQIRTFIADIIYV